MSLLSSRVKHSIYWSIILFCPRIHAKQRKKQHFPTKRGTFILAVYIKAYCVGFYSRPVIRWACSSDRLAPVETLTNDYSTILPQMESTAAQHSRNSQSDNGAQQHPLIQIEQGNLVALATLTSKAWVQITPCDSAAQGSTSKPHSSPKLSSSGRNCSKECSLFTIDFATINQAYVCVIR